MTSFSKTEPSAVATRPSELAVFADMLASMRPAGSKAEKRFIAKYLVPLGTAPDAHGNHWLAIPMPDGTPSRVMWSSHTDTVHRQGGVQDLEVEKGVVSAVRSNCLGADCTTGVWIMRQMILAKVPGVYIFHRAEEVGGVGSAAIARRGDARLDGVKFAIAFDRKGFDSVITHQAGGRCASEAFVNSIAPMLPGAYKSDATGTFTDTANYVDFIPECTNLSVGYLGQHTSGEVQDIAHAVRLAGAMAKFDETRLVAERDPQAEHDYPADTCVQGIMQAWGWEDDLALWDKQSRKAANSNGYWDRQPPRTLRGLVRDYPDEVADLLEQHGYDVATLLSEFGMGN